MKYITNRHGDRCTYINGVYHSYNDEPAHITFDGDQFWYKNGLQHRDGGMPAVICSNGYRAWYSDDKLNRIDGPAIIHSNGTVEYWINGVFHKRVPRINMTKSARNN